MFLDDFNSFNNVDMFISDNNDLIIFNYILIIINKFLYILIKKTKTYYKPNILFFGILGFGFIACCARHSPYRGKPSGTQILPGLKTG